MKTNKQKQILTDYANRAKEDPSFFAKVQTFFKMVKAHFDGTFKIKSSVMLIIIGAVIYTIVPIDFDFIPVLGWLDDITIIGYALTQLNKEIDRFMKTPYTKEGVMVVVNEE
ncbi:MAG: YkvA family protein [Flavobacteriales bacterium]